MSTATSAARRSLFLASSALVSLSLAAPAQAQADISVGSSLADSGQTGFVTSVAPDPQNGSASAVNLTAGGFVPAVAPDPYASAAPIPPLNLVAPDPQIVIANPGTSTTSRDPTNITGIGQMVVDQQNGFIGLCTGTLINPRTVLFAAHCVNTRAATAYGAGSGGVPISFGFQTDNLPALQRWFNATIGGQPNPLRYQSNPGMALYNVNQVRYNDLSLQPAANRFLYGDIATATLDTPAGNVPSWALLFSPLAQVPITAAGTGYNVGLVGYGSHGNASTGSASGSDFRRRIAENVLGALTDLRTFETFLFGASSSPTQNLYFIDFDDPRRGQPGASVFDFNAFRDNARGSEGITASGDSGGPLILQNIFNLQVAIGVLSGGYTRFYNGQPANGYGTVSFYQPIYLYWDWIAANNPYRYVTNLAGDRSWDDPSHWVTTLDPNYMIIGPDGQLVNGVPANPGEQNNGRSGQFGEMCFQTATRSQCLNVATGEFRDEPRPIGTDELAAGDHAGAMESDSPALARTGFLDGSIAELAPHAEGGASTTALPPATLANGLPGATNFVPNNRDPDRVSGAIGRYFDVNLAAAGTTTLGSTVTIDRFRITGANSRLTITSAGSLTSLIDVSQMTGTAIVNGRLVSRGDYLFMSGLLGGTGTVAAPYLTSVLGTIAPGGLNTIGTFTVEGNVVMSSGSQLLIDIGASGTSDRLRVVAGSGQPGTALLGGTLSINPVTRARFGSTYTVLTAAGGRTGQFNAFTQSLSAILFPVISYTATDVNVRIDARSFTTVIDSTSQNQRNFALLLDRNRQSGNYERLAEVFGELDVASVGGIRAAFESMAPRTLASQRGLGAMVTDSLARFTRDRQRFLGTGQAGGTLALIGNPVQLASASLSGGSSSAMLVGSDLASNMVQAEGALPDGVSAYVAGGYLNGRSRPLSGSGGRDHLDGWYAAAGVELERSPAFRIGFGLRYANSEADGAGQNAELDLVQATAYTNSELAGGFLVNSQLSIGAFTAETLRNVSIGPNNYRLRGRDNGAAFSGELMFGQLIDGGSVRLIPNAGLRFNILSFGDVTETGGAPALVTRGERYSSLQGRLGADLDGAFASGATTITPRLTAAYVHEFLNGQEQANVAFAGSGSAGGSVPFLLPGRDSDWGEIGAGVRVGGDRLSVDISADTTVGRQDVRYQSYRLGVNFRF